MAAAKRNVGNATPTLGSIATPFGLLAATGRRISEAFALRLSDITDDGPVLEKTKFKTSRLFPLHPSTRRAPGVIAWSLWRRAHQAAAQRAHIHVRLQL